MHRVGVVGVGEGLKAEHNRFPSLSRILACVPGLPVRIGPEMGTGRLTDRSKQNK